MQLRMLVALVVMALAGCSITKTVKPVTDSQITNLCIKNNPNILMDEFLPEVKRQIEAKGIRTSEFSGSAPPECKYTMEYTANWRWDLAMYLFYADLRVMQAGNMIGQATYDARSGGANMGKFGKTAEKVKPLINELFAQVAQKSN